LSCLAKKEWVQVRISILSEILKIKGKKLVAVADDEVKPIWWAVGSLPK